MGAIFSFAVFISAGHMVDYCTKKGDLAPPGSRQELFYMISTWVFLIISIGALIRSFIV